MKALASLAILCFFSIPAHAKPCTTHIRIAQSRFGETSELGPADEKWLHRKHSEICLDKEVTETTRYIFQIRDLNERLRTGTQTVNSTTTSTVHDASCPACPAIATIETPTHREVPYTESAHAFDLAIFDLKLDKPKIVATFTRNQVRQSGGDARAALFQNLTERHPIEGLLKDALKFIGKQAP